MISVAYLHPVFAQKCHDLSEGKSAYSICSEIPYDLHRYRDGWHVYWKDPPNGQIGRRLRTKKQLLAFLGGNGNVGIVLLAPNVGKLLLKEDKTNPENNPGSRYA